MQSKSHEAKWMSLFWVFGQISKLSGTWWVRTQVASHLPTWPNIQVVYTRTHTASCLENMCKGFSFQKTPSSSPQQNPFRHHQAICEQNGRCARPRQSGSNTAAVFFVLGHFLASVLFRLPFFAVCIIRWVLVGKSRSCRYGVKLV